MSALAVFCALLLTCAAGFGIAMPLLARRGKVSPAELAALVWLFGTAFISLALWVAGFFLTGAWLAGVVAVACAALFRGGLAALRKEGVTIEWPRKWSIVDLLLCGLLAAQFVAMIGLAYRASMDWDGLFLWEFKARVGFLNGGLPASYFSNAEWHPDYPLFLPMNEEWLYLWMGDANQFWVRIFSPFFYIATALLLYSGCSRLGGGRTGGLVAACLLFFVPRAMAGSGSFDSGYADFPLAAFYLAAAVELLVFLREGEPGDSTSLLLFAVLAGLLPWIKREGNVLWACIALAGALLAAANRRRPRLFFAALLPGALMLAVWTIFLRLKHTAANIDFVPMTSAVLQQHSGRLIALAHRLPHEFLNFDDWGLTWVGFAVALVLLALTKRWKPAALCLLFTALPIALVCFAYVFSAWPDYTKHVDSSLPRLMLQVTPVALLAMGLAVSGKGGAKASPD